MVHLYFLVAPRLRSKCRYASGRVRFVKPLLPLGVALAGVALFAVQICATDDGAGAEGFCVGEGHGISLPISAAARTMARRVAYDLPSGLSSSVTNTPVLLLTTDTFPNASKSNEIMKRSEEHTSELQSRPHLVCRL